MTQHSDQPNQPSQTPDEIALINRRQQLHEFLTECAACQEEIDPHWQYCAHCGTRLAVKCPGCGAPLPPAGAHSCPSCGLEIPKVAGPQA
ncbi:MAG: zinc ribbon domain-containing protein [Caldilineaceae bacterium]